MPGGRPRRQAARPQGVPDLPRVRREEGLQRRLALQPQDARRGAVAASRAASSTPRAATSRRASASCGSSRCTCRRAPPARIARRRSSASSRLSCPHLKRLRDRGHEIILCGDWNIAHKEIDLKNWRSNQKNSGFLPEERAWLTRVFDELGFVDVFRRLNDKPDQYTWWSNRGQAWKKNVGWRIDYQIATPGIAAARAGVDLQGEALLRPRAAHHRLRP